MFNAFAPSPVATTWATEASDPANVDSWLPSRGQIVQASLVGIGCYTVIKLGRRPRNVEPLLLRRKRDLKR